jgi:hypothetical protein
MEVKNNHVHVTTQKFLNKFIDINFSVGCMVWLWWCLFQDLTTSKNIDEICFILPLEIWKKHPQKCDTLAKLQKFSVLSCWPKSQFCFIKIAHCANYIHWFWVQTFHWRTPFILQVIDLCNYVNTYSRVHISSDTAFFKILKKPFIVQK